ncbi:hypothetical protein J2Y39_005244 [Pseudomonas sp. 2957]|jgi:hypothetical protein|nr:hypothetical protein [Pseudomonas sp. 2957]
MGLPSSLCGGDSVCRCGEPACENVALTRIIVGASLLAKAVCHSMWMYLIWRLREQARSHRDFGCAEDFGLAPDHCGSEPAREAVCHSTWMYLIWRLREQAHSYRGAVFSFSASTNAANAAEPWRRFG